MTANEAMLRVAKTMADKYGYIAESENEELDAAEDSFWGNIALGIEAHQKGEKKTVMSCRYVMPELQSEGKPQPNIHIDMFWGNPRLSLRLPDETFACVVYRDGVFSEAQAFRANGLELASTLKYLIDEEMKIS